MARLRTGSAGLVKNPREGSPFVAAVGQLIVNFGGIELTSHTWVTELARDSLLLDLAVELPLGKRIDLLLGLVDRERMPKRWKAASAKSWKRLQKLTEVRNLVAHGPVTFAWKGRSADGPPDQVGIANLKHIKSKYGRQLALTSLPELLPVIDEVAALGASLDSLQAQYRARLAKRRQQRGDGTA